MGSIALFKNMEFIHCKNKEEARKRASDALEGFLVEIKKESQPLLLLLSGGSAFGILDGIGRDVLGEHVTVSVLDERYSEDAKIHNFAQLFYTPFFTEALASGANYIDTRVQRDESLQKLGFRFESALKDWQRDHKKGIVCATMGIGEDGHTAGIMPFPENPDLFGQLFEQELTWVTAYDAGDKTPYPLRITATLPFLRSHVDCVFAYVVGEQKKKALRDVDVAEGSLAKTPARILREMKNVQIFTDIS